MMFPPPVKLPPQPGIIVPIKDKYIQFEPEYNFKIAKVIPIHKKKDINVISTCRPISLLSTLSKVFERVMHKQLYNYFMKTC